MVYYIFVDVKFPINFKFTKKNDYKRASFELLVVVFLLLFFNAFNT